MIRFQELGLEKGWGDCASRVSANIQLLLDLVEAPDPNTLEKFLGTIPMVFNVVILSPHGYFAQANVLGYPDTGGQVNTIPNKKKKNHLFAKLRLQNDKFPALTSPFADCLHPGPSPSSGKWDASQNKAAGARYHPSNTHCECENMFLRWKRIQRLFFLFRLL